MMIGHNTASIIAHYHAVNTAAVYSDCMLGEPQAGSLNRPDI